MSYPLSLYELRYVHSPVVPDLTLSDGEGQAKGLAPMNPCSGEEEVSASIYGPIKAMDSRKHHSLLNHMDLSVLRMSC
jgi:hypothetical protein